MTQHNVNRAQRGGTGRETRLHIAAIDCHAHGLCAELLPELISLDEWGYPILTQPEIPTELIRQARRAAAACPTLALRLHRPPHRREGAGRPKP